MRIDAGVGIVGLQTRHEVQVQNLRTIVDPLIANTDVIITRVDGVSGGRQQQVMTVLVTRNAESKRGDITGLDVKVFGNGLNGRSGRRSAADVARRDHRNVVQNANSEGTLAKVHAVAIAIGRCDVTG